MALLNIFKKKKIEKKEIKREVKSEKPVSPKLPQTSPAKRDEGEGKMKSLLHRPPIKKSVSSADAPERRKTSGEGYRILKTPRITEKATDLAEKNQYIFEIYPRANKNELKKAIKDIYGVDAVSVRIINVPRKKRRLGRIEGFRKGYKKAIIKIKEGQKIEVLPR